MSNYPMGMSREDLIYVGELVEGSPNEDEIIEYLEAYCNEHGLDVEDLTEEMIEDILNEWDAMEYDWTEPDPPEYDYAYDNYDPFKGP